MAKTNTERLHEIHGFLSGNLEKLGQHLGWWIWHGIALKGWNGNVSPAARVVGTDKASNETLQRVIRIEAKVDALAGAFAKTQQGETFDPAKYNESIAAAVKEGLEGLVEAGSAEVALKFKTEQPKES